MKISLRNNAYTVALPTASNASLILGSFLLGAAFFVAIPAHAQVGGITRASLVELANADRAKSGLGELTEDALLTTAAQMRADDMATKGYFSHTSPEGRTPWYWFRSVGYYYYTAGENLAVAFTSAEDAERAWMNSPTHRANILKDSYTRIGIGLARGVYKGQPAIYFVQFFAKPYVATLAKKRAPVSSAYAARREQVL